MTAPRRSAPTARALFSLSGLVVLGGYVLMELWLFTAALRGPTAYAMRLERLTGRGGWVLGLVVLLGLAFHASYGIVLALRPELNVVRLGHGRGWFFAIQRVSALALIVFLSLHLAFFWVPLANGTLSPADAHHLWVRRLSTTASGVPFAALGYAFGIATCAFHLAYGAFLAALRWGLLTSRESRRRSGPAFAVLGLSLFAAGFLPVVQLATGDRLVDHAPVEAGRCDLPEGR